MNDTDPKSLTPMLTDFGDKPTRKDKSGQPVRPPASAKPSTDQANDAEPRAADPEPEAPPGISPCGPSSDSGPRPDGAAFVEKRSEQRFMIKVPAVLQLDSGTIECSTFDLSEGGVKLKLKHDLFKNVRVNIANFGEITGEIIWRDDDYVGIKFDEDQSEIVRALARVAS